ncbi:MAG: OmpH family outer membrane protein [Cyclobacteriaceae bacterium]|nr:OmpH family outer membrane protein [Cytophagales bacterium]MCZ8328260.1 OmpH family outer membrane protein [Cyclobacteriaceae bacterium]
MQKFQWALNIVFVLSLAITLYLLFQKNEKVVYVDSVKLVNGYEGMIAAKKKYQEKTIGWKANLDTLQKEVQLQIMDFEKNISSMTRKEKELSKELLNTKKNQFEQYQQAINLQAQQEDQKMTTEVLTQVNAYLKKFGEKNGYTIIFAATEYGNIAYAKDELNITDEVLKGLNAEYKGQ